MNQNWISAQVSALLGLVLFFGSASVVDAQQKPRPLTTVNGSAHIGPSDVTWSASVVHGQMPKPSGTLKHGSFAITCLLFSRNGDILVSQCEWQPAQALKFWDMTTKKSTVGRGSHSVIALSPDGRTLAGGNVPPGSRLLDLWDRVGGKASTLRDEKYDGALSMAFSPDGKLLAAGGAEETIVVWDWAGGKFSAALKGDDARVGALAFSADSKVLAAGNYNDKIDLWDLSTGTKTATLKGHADHVSSLSFSPDGKTLASGSDDRTIMLWNIATGKSISILKGHPAKIWYVAISADGKTLVSGSSDGTIKLWNISTGQNTATLTGTCGKPALSVDGKMLATGNDRGEIQLWDMPAVAAGK